MPETKTLLRHPDYYDQSNDWLEWRETFRGGREYRDRYLKRWSDRETNPDFRVRQACTPIPTFAKAAILDIRNSIFQRLEDVVRNGGSASYNRAVKGEGGGVDREGQSMNSFIGIDVLTELLVMGKVGVYVDAPSVMPLSLADQLRRKDLVPYCYYYRREDIINYKMDASENPGTFAAVVLRDHAITCGDDLVPEIDLPTGREQRIRYVWKDPVTGKVRVKMYKDDGDYTPIELEGADPDGALTLELDVIPFIMPDIGDSLMSDICSYQHALLNLVSGDVNWAMKANTPFLTIQKDMRTMGAHLKQAGGANTAEPGGQHSESKEEQIGGRGRYYDINTDRPDYIAPPSEPLMASIKLQEKLEDDIRKLVNLSVANKAGSRTESAEAKKLSSQGLEAGLSFIGLVLQDTEQKIANYWAAYEDVNPSTVSYPQRYILKQDIERIEEAKGMIDLIGRIPSPSAKKAMARQIIITMLGGKENSDSISKMVEEVQTAGYSTLSFQEVIMAHAAGLVSDETASDQAGYKGDKEVEQAREDKAERAKLTLLAQTSVNGESGLTQVGTGARGVDDLDPEPQKSAQQEKEASQNE